MSDSKQVLAREMESLKNDIIRAYGQSGKKVSGEFQKGLSVNVRTTKTSTIATLEGYTYLAGRAAGKMPPIAPLLEWVKNKGIFSFESEQQASGIAWAIAKKIAREGTNSRYHLQIYDEVITPQRIQRIIDAVTEINVNEFVEAITAEFRKLTTNI